MKKLSEFKNHRERREYLEKELGIDLSDTSKVLIDKPDKIHCENLIGAISLPLGVAGPITIQNSKLRIKNCYIPLATTEGALVASINRGCKVINLSGGANVNSYYSGATRGPVFYTGSIIKGEQLSQWIKNHHSLLTDTANKTSRHLKLLQINIQTIADYSFLQIYFDTSEAMGMNMATIASEAICQIIEQKTKFKCLTVAGNFDVDKKPAWLNFVNGRGYKIWAEVVIPQKILLTNLKVTSSQFYQVWLAKCMIGSAISGSLGFNSHFANIVAAFFSATGQDLAHIVEGSLGITTTKVLDNNDLYISIYLPDVMLGTIGGGTGLATQSQARSITKAKITLELTEVLAAAILAGELSLLASLAEGTLAQVHKNLGR